MAGYFGDTMELFTILFVLLALLGSRFAEPEDFYPHTLYVFGFLKKVGKGLGSIAKKAAPVVGLIPGVGTIAAAGIGGLGGLLSDGNLRGILEGAAGGAAGGLLGKIPGIGNAAQKLGGLLTGGDGFGLGDLGSIAQVAIPAIGAYQGSKQAGQDSDLARQLFMEAIERQRANADRANAEFELSAPMRAAFRSGAMNFFDPTNPFNMGPMAEPAATAAPPPATPVLGPISGSGSSGGSSPGPVGPTIMDMIQGGMPPMEVPLG